MTVARLQIVLLILIAIASVGALALLQMDADRRIVDACVAIGFTATFLAMFLNFRRQ